MPAPVSHLAVGYAMGACARQGVPVCRICVVAAACAALPDIDVLVSTLPISHGPLLGHPPRSPSGAFAFPGRRSAIRAGVSVPSCARKRFLSFSQPSS